MKQISLIVLALAAAVSSNAFGETGTLTFTGNLNTSTYTITPGGDAGAGGSVGVIDVATGDVAFADLSSALFKSDNQIIYLGSVGMFMLT